MTAKYTATKSLATAILSTALMLFAISANAADPLHNTTWQTIDDETGKPKGIIKITEQKGNLVGTLVKSYKYPKGTVCKTCKGTYANKPLTNATIFWNLSSKGGNTYTGGKIFDPQKGKDYKLKGELINNGKSFKLVGYVGPFPTALTSREQVWKRLK